MTNANHAYISVNKRVTYFLRSPAGGGPGVVLWRRSEVEDGLFSEVQVSWFRDRPRARLYMLAHLANEV